MFGIKSVHCPFCLKFVSVDKKTYRCLNPDCHVKLDAGYVNFYSSHPAFFVPLLGASGVGKTVYLQILMLTLRQINRLWTKSCSVAADIETLDYIKNSAATYAANNIPPMTQVGVQEVYTMYLQNVTPWRDMTLVFRDLSGENYNNLIFPKEVVRFLSEQSLLFMMLSLPEVLQGNYSIDELIHSFVHTHQSLGGRSPRKKKKMIVILSQADSIPRMPQRIKDYLCNDNVWKTLQSRDKPIDSDVFMPNYLRGMHQANLDIKSWLRYELAPVMNLANNSYIDLYFCIISSLGAPPTEGKLTRPLHPYRVLDPLLWALELDSSREK